MMPSIDRLQQIMFLQFFNKYQQIANELRAHQTKVESSFERIELFLKLVHEAFQILNLPYTKHNLERVDYVVRNDCVGAYFSDVDVFLSQDTFSSDERLRNIIFAYSEKRSSFDLSDIIAIIGCPVTFYNSEALQLWLENQISYPELFMILQPSDVEPEDLGCELQ